MKFSIKDFFSKCDQIRRKLRIWSHLLRKSLMVNFIFCTVTPLFNGSSYAHSLSSKIIQRHAKWSLLTHFSPVSQFKAYPHPKKKIPAYTRSMNINIRVVRQLPLSALRKRFLN